MILPKPGIYRASEAGGCPRALAAARLGYELVPQKSGGIVMKEGKRHEAHIAEDLSAMGYELEDAGECQRCKEEFGETGISGHHVEVNTFLIRLIGHIDRFLRIDGQQYPCEFKSMGLFVFQKFKRHLLSAFPGYEAQEACYIGFMERPGLYVVKNRDSGEMLIYTVPHGGQIIPGHPILPIFVTLEQVIDKLHLVEVSVRGGELPECEVALEERRWCAFRYLCMEINKEKKEKLPKIGQEELLEAAALWIEGKELERQAGDRIEHAKQVFLSHAYTHPKFQVGEVGVSYSGSKTRRWLDEKTLRELVAQDILAKAQRESKPFEDIRIRVLEES